MQSDYGCGLLKGLVCTAKGKYCSNIEAVVFLKAYVYMSIGLNTKGKTWMFLFVTVFVAVTCQLFSISLNRMILKALDNSRSGADFDNL